MRFGRLILFTLFLVITVADSARASGDIGCSPVFSLNHGKYDACSNVPFLLPGNDTMVNLKLLLVDTGRATLEAKPVDKEDAISGYGKVPFTVERFEGDIFKSRIDPDRPASKDDSSVQGLGSRCVSNDSGIDDFIRAVEQSKDLSSEERRRLIEARKKLVPDCVDSPASKKPSINKGSMSGSSPLFGEFSRYIDAAAAFYSGRFGEAGSGFAGLRESGHPWLREASYYMMGRTQLNLAQQKAYDADGFVDLGKVDKRALRSAEAEFNTYQRKYPEGNYAASARGLLRRVYWLSGQADKLAAEYALQLNRPQSRRTNVSLYELTREIDQKLLVSLKPSQAKDPLTAATLDLSMMRVTGTGKDKPISFSDLQKQRPLFEHHGALFDYLLAAHYFYVQKDARNALKHLSDTIPKEMTYLDLSRLVLRGMALEATKDHAGARKLWTALLPQSRKPLQAETVQLALAINYERVGMTEELFKAGSPVTEPKIRAILLKNTASAALLRSVIQSKSTTSGERDIALSTLLYKDLLQGRYGDYIEDHRLLPGDAARRTPSPYDNPDEQPRLKTFTWSSKKSEDSYNCSSTLAIAGKLAKNPKDPQGLLCLGDFVRANDLEPGGEPSGGAPQGADRLGSGPTQFPGPLFSRGEAYKTVVADPKAVTDQKAYALFRLVKCYEPTGSNHCGGKTVEKQVRKSWFRALKTRYSDTEWSKSLLYYW